MKSLDLSFSNFTAKLKKKQLELVLEATDGLHPYWYFEYWT